MTRLGPWKNESQRLEKICHDRHIDTRTRKQKVGDKEREQAADDTSRNNSRPRFDGSNGTRLVRPVKERPPRMTGIVSKSTVTSPQTTQLSWPLVSAAIRSTLP
jgi:hypothetical protein